MDHAELEDLLALAALGRLDAPDEAALEAHLREGCAQCEAELRALREAAAALALSLEPAPAEQRLWLKLKARLDQSLPQASPAGRFSAPEVGERQAQSAERPTAPRASRPAGHERYDAALRRTPRVWPWRVATGMAAAAALVLAFFAGGAAREFGRIDRQRRLRIAQLEKQALSLSSERSAARTQAVRLEQALNRRARLQSVLMASDAHMMHLKPLGPAPGARALVAMSATRRSAVIQAAGLPPTPAGKAYEMWWITKQHGPVPAGIFHAETGREVIASIDPPPSGERLLMAAVTLEPAAGVAKPTGRMYLKAPIPAN
jgi:hypothetical protein